MISKQSAYKSGDCVLIDHDATVHAKHFYDHMWDPQPGELSGWPGNKRLESVMKDASGHKPFDFSKVTN